MTTKPTTIVAITQDEFHGCIVPPQLSLQYDLEISMVPETAECHDSGSRKGESQNSAFSIQHIPKQQKDESSKEENHSANVDVLHLLPLRSLTTMQLMEYRWVIENEIKYGRQPICMILAIAFS
jgi:hypothetical protein